MDKNILKKFCSKDQLLLNQPFFIDPYTFAANRQIMIRIKGKLDYCNVVHVPEMHDLGWDKIKTAKNWTEIKKEEILKIRDKDICKQCSPHVSNMPKKCDECEGTGDVEFDNCYNMYDFECKGCGGDGYDEIRPLFPVSECPNCKGTRFETFYMSYPVSDQIFVSIGYLVLAVENLGNIKVTTEGVKKNSPVPFIFDGGEGMIMPKVRTN